MSSFRINNNNPVIGLSYRHRHASNAVNKEIQEIVKQYHIVHGELEDYMRIPVSLKEL